MNPWTVGELTQYIKDLLESAPELRGAWLTGEISNFSPARSGHLYFTLKDAEAAIDCVMWCSAAGRLTWEPEHGMAVVVRGHVSIYPPRGRYQFYVDLLAAMESAMKDNGYSSFLAVAHRRRAGDTGRRDCRGDP